MALLHEVTTSFLRRCAQREANLPQAWALQCRRSMATGVQEEVNELEKSSFLTNEANTGSGDAVEFDPVAASKARKRQLPSSRYQYRSPRYFKGPLSPHQVPPASDPASREFVPGPFSLPRLRQTYNDTLAADLMTLSYTHFPPTYSAAQKGERLRSWDGASPYYKNRPLRGPRGGDVLRLLRKPTSFTNIPHLKRITVHSMLKEVSATNSSAPLHVAGMALQAITGVRAESHAAKKSVAGFGIKKGQYLSLTCDLQGEQMYHFLSKLVDVVMPKIKDWRGVKGSSGDSSGNIAFGFTKEEVAAFPEIEVNYDMYPQKLIPGCHVIVHTSATNDRDARMLLSSIGIPFYGKQIN